MNPKKDGGAHATMTPHRSRWTTVLPAGVAAVTLALIGWSAWPVVRPVRPVHVVQAVHDRTESPPAPSGGEPARRTGKTVQAAGWLEAEPFYVACSALTDGVIESVEVLEGDRVERGQVVARLVSEDSEFRLAFAEAALEGARAELARAEAELRAAQTDWDEPVERERAIAVGRAALAEARSELEQLPALIEAERATLVRLEEEQSRAEESEQRGAATDIERIIAQQRTAAQRATLEALQARRPLLEARVRRREAELRAAERDFEYRIEERRRLEDAKARVALARARVGRAQATRDEAALELERTEIRAPIGGFVQRRLKVPGDKVMLGMDSEHSAHVVHLYDPSRIQVRVDVPLADAANVFVGQACEVVVEVLPDTTFRGEVLRVTHEADLQKNTLQVKVGVTDPSPLLRPEMLTRVKFLGDAAGGGTGSAQGAPPASTTLVPTGAIRERGEIRDVLVVRSRRGDRGVVEAATVEIVEEREGWSRVRGPIVPGALLVVGADEVAPGERVRVSATKVEEAS
ncbi:MAG: efflux RND transporter periplasmic adaptor subunit [Phycisphaerales bacterium JB059]